MLFFAVLAHKAVSGEIALTFDDAPTGNTAIMTGAERSSKVLNALVNNQVPGAMIFVTTANIGENGEQRLKHYTDAGFRLANHSHSHQSASKIGVYNYLADARKAQKLLHAHENLSPFHRFPYLHYGRDTYSIQTLQAVLNNMGYRNGYVTVDNYEWYINAVLVKAKEENKNIDWAKVEALYVDIIWEAILFYDEIAKSTIGRSPKHVLLLHENDASALFLPALIQHIRSQGWKIISADEAYTDPIAARFPNTTFHNQGRVAAIAHEKGTEESLLRHETESTTFIDRIIQERAIITE